MALIRCDFFSEALQLSTSMTVLLPQPAAGQIGLAVPARDTDPPVLYLLHGLSDDDTAWTRYTSLERHATQRGLAVVMPQVHRSFYADEAHGGRFWTFLSEELPTVVATLFRVSRRREDTFVAGLSMGGYGAFKWALRAPERFAAAASLSGVLDLAGWQRRGTLPDLQEVLQRVYAGLPITGTDHDLLHLVAAAEPAELPRLAVFCGVRDELYDDNRRFLHACRQRGVPVDVDFGPGAHEWDYWDGKVADLLDWLQSAAGR